MWCAQVGLLLGRVGVGQRNLVYKLLLLQSKPVTDPSEILANFARRVVGRRRISFMPSDWSFQLM